MTIKPSASFDINESRQFFANLLATTDDPRLRAKHFVTLHRLERRHALELEGLSAEEARRQAQREFPSLPATTIDDDDEDEEDEDG